MDWGSEAACASAELAGAPFSPGSSLAQSLVRHFHPAPLTEAQAFVVLAVAACLVTVACLAFRRIGVTPFETLALLVAAPLVAHVEGDFWTANESATLAFNAAGFLIPAVVALKMIVEGRAPLWAMLLVLVTGTAASYFASYAVPNEGVLLYYRVPSLVAAAVAVALARGRSLTIGPLAYVAGAGGVIFGADALRLRELLASDAPHRIVIGGAGVLDGIFLVGLLALVLATLADGALSSLGAAAEARRARGATPPATEASRSATRDVGGLG